MLEGATVRHERETLLGRAESLLGLIGHIYTLYDIWCAMGIAAAILGSGILLNASFPFLLAATVVTFVVLLAGSRLTQSTRAMLGNIQTGVTKEQGQRFITVEIQNAGPVSAYDVFYHAGWCPAGSPQEFEYFPVENVFDEIVPGAPLRSFFPMPPDQSGIWLFVFVAYRERQRGPKTERRFFVQLNAEGHALALNMDDRRKLEDQVNRLDELERERDRHVKRPS